MAAEQQSTTTNEQDLLSIASAGVYQLSAAEMDQVEGGKKLKIRIGFRPLKLEIEWK